MGNVLGYRGLIKQDDASRIRTILGEPFYVRRSKHQRSALVACRCKCGGVDVVRIIDLCHSCMKCKGIESRTRNGESKTRLYKTWNGMIARCYIASRDDYSRYGGRGVSVCQQWRDDFLAFKEWAMNNGYSGKLTIERKDNSGNYEPSNCCWATMVEQCRNRRSSVFIEAWGESKTQEEWARDPRATVLEMGIIRRLRRGMSPEEAISGGKSLNSQRKTTVAWGECKTNADWARDQRCGVSINTIRRRLRSGMSPENAISSPPK